MQYNYLESLNGYFTVGYRLNINGNTLKMKLFERQSVLNEYLGHVVEVK